MDDIQSVGGFARADASERPQSDESALVFGAQLRRRLIYLAKRRYRLRDDVAEDLIQAALGTFIEVEHRYPNTSEHPKILVGIMRNRCRDYIRREVKRAKHVREVRLDVSLLEAEVAPGRATRLFPGRRQSI